MARHSRDGCLAVVRPDCDVRQMGALMQVQSEQPLSCSYPEMAEMDSATWEGAGKQPGLNRISSVKLRRAVVEQP